jgi:putative nucleotidyltransferase with HDIG domain
MSRIDELVARVNELPPLPDTILRLLGVLHDPDATVADMVEAIRYDQAVTAEILRVCNSAYFGLPRGLHSLSDAMRYLGTLRVVNLVVAMHANSMLGRPQPGYGLPAGALWRHSVGVALASSAFSDRINLVNRGLCFTAGLLHDIGKVLMSEYVAGEIGKILDEVGTGKFSFLEAEERVVGFSHAEVGERLAMQWRLPEPIVRCIRYHHQPQQLLPPDPLVEVVYLANCVCLLCGVGLGVEELTYRADAAVMERHHLQECDLEVIGAQMLTDLRNVEQAFVGASQKCASRQVLARQE